MIKNSWGTTNFLFDVVDSILWDNNGDRNKEKNKKKLSEQSDQFLAIQSSF